MNTCWEFGTPLPSSSVKGLQLADEGGIKEKAPVKAKPGSMPMEKASWRVGRDFLCRDLFCIRWPSKHACLQERNESSCDCEEKIPHPSFDKHKLKTCRRSRAVYARAEKVSTDNRGRNFLSDEGSSARLQYCATDLPWYLYSSLVKKNYTPLHVLCFVEQCGRVVCELAALTIPSSNFFLMYYNVCWLVYLYAKLNHLLSALQISERPGC